MVSSKKQLNSDLSPSQYETSRPILDLLTFIDTSFKNSIE